MSTNQLTTGWIGKLIKPLSEEQAEVRNEELYKDGSDLRLNYEGTLVYLVDHQEELDQFAGLTLQDNAGMIEYHFLTEADGESLSVDHGKARRYIDIWYNGTDDSRSVLTLIEFEAMLEKEIE